MEGQGKDEKVTVKFNLHQNAFSISTVLFGDQYSAYLYRNSMPALKSA